MKILCVSPTFMRRLNWSGGYYNSTFPQSWSSDREHATRVSDEEESIIRAEHPLIEIISVSL
jgi:hypothetical protein